MKTDESMDEAFPSCPTSELRLKTIWADRGQTVESAQWGEDPSRHATFAILSRSASLETTEDQASFWIVVRGTAHLTCRECTFWLQAGTWIAVDRGSAPTLMCGKNTIVLALVFPSVDGASSLDRPDFSTIFPGKGKISTRNLRIAFDVWKSARSGAALARGNNGVEFFRRATFFLSTLQHELQPLLSRCPGRALARRRQVLARMQRAVLYLEGNMNRTISSSQLAKVSNFSSWYFSKTFSAIYEQGAREMTTALRLESACDLLRRTDLSVGEVGSRCGFQNACSFARAFRSYHGTTASEFRKVQRAATMMSHSSDWEQLLWNTAEVAPHTFDNRAMETAFSAPRRHC